MAEYPVAINDVATVTDDVTRQADFPRAAQDTLADPPDIANAQASFERTQSATVTATDDGDGSAEYGRSAQAAVTTETTVSREATFERTGSSELLAPDAAAAQSDFARLPQASVSAVDELVLNSGDLQLPDAITTTDEVAFTTVSLHLIDSADTEDVATRECTIVVVVDETVTTADTSEWGWVVAGIVEDTIDTPDAAGAVSAYGRIPSDTVSIADSASTALWYARRRNDNIATQDEVHTAGQVFYRYIEDEVLAVDVAAAHVCLYEVEINDAISTSDVVWLAEPATYWFITEAVIPVCDDWPCLCIGPDMSDATALPDVQISRGDPWIVTDGNLRMVMTSDDGILTSYFLELPFQQQHTFEAEFCPTSLPNNLLDLTQARFFIGVYDKQDNAGGVLISTLGIALTASFGSSAIILPGSQNLFTEGNTSYTLRIVIDGAQDVMHLYVTETSQIPVTGQVLRYTTAAPVTPSGTPDSFRIEVLGNAGKTTQIKFSGLRADCDTARIPNLRPIADAGPDQTATLASAVTHDGRNSYDPEGEPLTYLWSLVDAPDGSRYKTTGTDGSTSDDGDHDGYTDVFNGGTDAFSVANAPLLQPGDTLTILGVNYYVSTTRWTYDPATQKYTRGGGWNDDELVITEEALPDALSDVAWVLLHGATYFSDRTSSTPYAIPDMTGVFMVQLIVNDGELDSLPDTALLNTLRTAVALGCTPDLSWIWNLLSDFWNLLEDREVVETVWSGFAQAAAAQLLTAWQVDYNKSLVDIQRVFQRRWLGYDTNVDDDPETAAIRIVRGPIVSNDLAAGASVNGLTLQVILDGGSVQTVTFVGTDPLSAQTIADQINEALGYGTAQSKIASVVVQTGSWSGTYLVLDYPLLLRIRPNGTANALLGFSTAAYTQNDLCGSGLPVYPPDDLPSYAFEALMPYVLDFDEEGIQRDDLLVFQDLGYRVQKTSAITGETAIRGLTMLDELPTGLTEVKPWLLSSSVLSVELDFDALLIGSGDIARFYVKNLTTGARTEIYCQVTGARDYTVGFDPAPLLEFYNGDVSNFETQFLGVKHVNCIPVDDLVVDIPRLQEIIKDPPSFLEVNADFTISMVGDQNAIVFKAGTFSYLDAPPDTLWAEITYLDNRPTIEANFGDLVNFKVEHLDAVTSDLDYLSAVRGLWWAYFGGPAVAKVRAGVQILLGLPFAEVAGTITSVMANFSATEGRLIIEDTAPPNTPRTYYYPLAAELGINPDTGVAFAVGDVVAQFTPLCGGVEVYDYINSPMWAQRYVSQGKFSEIGKLFRFLVRADVDTFNLINLSFALDFVRKIKPHYTYPLFVMLKHVKACEVDVTDELKMRALLALFDSSCPMYTTSAWRWDDTDESGHWNYDYDATTPPPQFIHDTHRLCPAEDLYAHMFYIHPGNAGWFFDTIWAYDDGGGRDRLTLHGPDHLPPPPYGPAVGIIHHDALVTAGVYHRIRPL